MTVMGAAERVFLRPNATAAVLLLFGLSALAFQWRLPWSSGYAPSELLFLAFACGAAYAGSWIVTRVPATVSEAAEHLARAASGEGDGVRDVSIGPGGWLGLGALGILVSLAAVYTHDAAGIPWTGAARALYFLSVFLNFWVVGVTLGLYAVALAWLARLSRMEPALEPYAWRPELMADVSATYLRLTTFAVALYLLGLLAIWLSPGGSLFFSEGDLVRQLWILPLAFGVAAYFFLTQLLAHRIMLKAKSSRLRYLRARRETEFKKWERERGADQAQAVEFLTRTIDDISREGTWPLRLPQLLSFLVPILAPASNELVALATAFLGGDAR